MNGAEMGMLSNSAAADAPQVFDPTHSIEGVKKGEVSATVNPKVGQGGQLTSAI
jgi:hypothetical protein